MDRENYLEALRLEVVEVVARDLSPIAARYGYSEVPLEVNIKWRPSVLILGNYSSGKSTLINELLQTEVQATGQAPTDDSFTVITFGEADGPIRVVEERDGKALLHDPEYPFEQLRKHGQRFSAHFRLKKVNAPLLKSLALIDTPGMLDSIAERDRGYDYQQVIGDLAQVADLILVLFDPHKAGTVREAHASLRETLPQRTFEDRVLFVLNRIDECANLTDLLRVYGTLCWNLSQMTGRKDIPTIKLTYSDAGMRQSGHAPDGSLGYLQFLQNQREDLKKAIAEAPTRRLDHLASYVEVHSERLSHLLEALLQYCRDRRAQKWRLLAFGGLLSLVAAALVMGFLWQSGMLSEFNEWWLGGVTLIAVTASLVLWYILFFGALLSLWHGKRLRQLDKLTTLTTQSRKDSWQAVKPLVETQLRANASTLKVKTLRHELKACDKVMTKGSREIREALREFYTIREPSAG